MAHTLNVYKLGFKCDLSNRNDVNFKYLSLSSFNVPNNKQYLKFHMLEVTEFRSDFQSVRHK